MPNRYRLSVTATGATPLLGQLDNIPTNMIYPAYTAGNADFLDQRGIPLLELPPNCTIVATVHPGHTPNPGVVWEQIYLRLLYGQLGSAAAQLADAPLLTPTDGGDGADQVG